MTKDLKTTGKSQQDQQEQGKTLFEYMGFTGNKDSKLNKKMERMKKLLIACAVYIVIGYVIGVMLDIMLETNYYSILLALALFLFWIVRVFGPYLKIK